MRDTIRLPLDQIAPYTLELPKPLTPALISWQQLFANDFPVEIEVGFGKGQFLVDSAKARPTVNFFGIEVQRGLQLYVATRIAKRRFANAKVACLDAGWFLEHCVLPASVQAVHVYFPDPWWKRRHRKRRVFCAEFVAAAERAIAPGGTLYIASDVEEYFKVMTRLMTTRPAFTMIAERIEAGPVDDVSVLTNFERKARLKGGNVWRATYCRQTSE